MAACCTVSAPTMRSPQVKTFCFHQKTPSNTKPPGEERDYQRRQMTCPNVTSCQVAELAVIPDWSPPALSSKPSSTFFFREHGRTD